MHFGVQSPKTEPQLLVQEHPNLNTEIAKQPANVSELGGMLFSRCEQPLSLVN